jgi:hypothetical protein
MSSPDRYFRLALFFGLAPLVVGSGVFLLWCAAGWDWLMFAGLLTMWGGIASLIAGGLCLTAFAVKAAASQPRPPIGPRVAMALVALLVNIPVAFCIVVAAMQMFLRVELTVVNNGADLDHLVVFGGCGEADFGSVPSGATRVERLVVGCDGGLELHAVRSGNQLSGVVASYVTPGEHLDLRLTFAADGSWSVAEGGASPSAGR